MNTVTVLLPAPLVLAATAPGRVRRAAAHRGTRPRARHRHAAGRC